MAAWQFHFSLVPTAGIAKHHGRMVDYLPQYLPRDPDAPLKEQDDFLNYWEGIEMPAQKLAALECLLPQMKSWSGDARMYGDDASNRIEIWSDEICCDIDASQPYLPLLTYIVDLACEMDCKVVLKEGGRVLEPELPVILELLKHSRAMRFVVDPISFLKDRDR